MKKGFTLAETLITMAIIGIIMALSIPAVIQSTNDTKPLFKKAYNTVEQVVAELLNDVSLYPAGEFSNNTFCNCFFSKLNTIGYNYVGNTCANTFASIQIPTGPTTPNTPNAVTSNAMEWYNMHEDFDPTLCPTELISFSCMKISVDVNGYNKGADIELPTDAANRDIFNIYITTTGKVYVPADSAEATLLKN